MSLHSHFGTLAKCLVHPLAGRRFLRSLEEHTLEFEFLADPIVEIDAARHHIAPEDTGSFVGDRETTAQIFVGFPGEKSDLAFIVIFVVKEAVADEPFSGNALDL